MHRIRIKYKKSLIFIGHLDMVRLWERTIRRADIPVAYSQGFNPRQKLSFGPPLSLGIASECEFLDIYADKWMNPEEVKNRLRLVLPSGIEIIETSNLFEGLPSLSASITKAEYSMQAKGISQKTIDNILSSSEIIVKRKEKEVNIRPLIDTVSYSDGVLRVIVKCGEKGTVRPNEIRSMFQEAHNLIRTGLY